MDRSLQSLVAHQSELAACRRCDDMSGPVVIGAAAMSPIIQVGQAPGRREGEFGRPFASSMSEGDPMRSRRLTEIRGTLPDVPAGP